MRRALLILAFVAIPPLLHAQVVGQPQQITIVDSGTACVTAPTACATFALDSQTGGLTLSISGTWTGTLTFESTNNDGIWTSVLATNLATGAQATTTTASGLFSVTNAGVIKVRARATAAMTGSALVTAAKGIGFARLFGPSPTFTRVLVGDGDASAPAVARSSVPTHGLWFEANILNLSNGTNAQTFRVYNTFTDASNNEFGYMRWSGNTFQIGMEENGTGVPRNFELATDNSTGVQAVVLRFDAGTNQVVLGASNTNTVLTKTGLISDNPGAPIGYTTGAGGTVTQATSKATGVTLNTVSGQITMNAAALAAGAKVSFVVTNSAVAATDGPFVWVTSGGTANAYRASVAAVASGSFTVTVENITAGSLSEAPVIGFNLMKGASS